MNNIVIKLARKEDEDDVLTLWLGLHEEQASLEPELVLAEDASTRFRNDFKQWVVANHVRRLVVAVKEGDIIGYAAAHLMWPPAIYEQQLEAYLDEIYVIPDQRREGVGTELVEHIKSWVDTTDANSLRLGVAAQNQPARAFWRQAGAVDFTVTMTLRL